MIRIAVMGIGLASAAFGQGPRFEVASIKPASPDARGSYIDNLPGGRMDISNFTLRQMIIFAWKLQPDQVAGGPPWIETEHFNINAKAETKPSDGDMQLMVRALLEDRFQLAVRHENKEMPIYEIVLARKDGKLGAKMTATPEGSCVPFDPQHPPPPPERGAPPPVVRCGTMRLGASMLQGTGAELKNVASLLSRVLGRTVIDKTGLSGMYNIQAEWTPEAGQPLQGPPPQGPAGDRAAETGPSIYTAFQEQLGLKIVSAKGLVEMIIVEKAERPSEN